MLHIPPPPPNRTLYIYNNLPVLRGINSECIDLIATDPPFNKKRPFNAPLGSKAAGQEFDDRWKWDEVTGEWHDLIATDYPAIKEIIEAAIVIEGGRVDEYGKTDTGKVRNSVAAFLVWMAPRLIEMRRILKATGTIYLHCDPEAGHYLKLLMDAIFGKQNFRNEIVWQRTITRKGNLKKGLAKDADTILRYSKTNKFIWNSEAVTIPYDLDNLDEKTKKKYSNIDSSGRLYQLTAINAPKQDPDSKCTYEVMGITRTWRWTKERMEQEIANGRVVQTKPGNVPRQIRYLDEQKGKTLNCIWTDIPAINSQAKERTGWDTQKPLALYSRIIQASSNKGDTVIDPFCGCATTCVAAELLERKWIGIDIDPVAETITANRLNDEVGVWQEGDKEYFSVKKHPPKRTDIPSVNAKQMRLTLWKRQGRRCANPYCSLNLNNQDMRKEDVHLDHVIPKSRGGADGIDNRIALCGNCNMRKSSKAWGAFLDEERSKQPHPKV